MVSWMQLSWTMWVVGRKTWDRGPERQAQGVMTARRKEGATAIWVRSNMVLPRGRQFRLRPTDRSRLGGMLFRAVSSTKTTLWTWTTWHPRRHVLVKSAANERWRPVERGRVVVVECRP